MAQCATGENWRTKKGEPAIGRWRPLIDWSADVVRAVAVPWRIGDDDGRRHELLIACRDFDNAIILDRPRLVVGRPDAFLSSAASTAVRDWCSARLGEFPRLAD